MLKMRSTIIGQFILVEIPLLADMHGAQMDMAQ